MSHFKLGETEKANEYRDKLNEAMKLNAFKDDDECLSFLKEAEILFESTANKIEINLLDFHLGYRSTG